MPVSFKQRVNIEVMIPTPSGSLIAHASGINAAGSVGIDKQAGTGYTNPYTSRTITATYNPKVLQRYDKDAGGYRFIGECSLKLDPQHRDLLDQGDYIVFKDVEWQYRQLDELGEGMGNDRIVLALNRK